MVLSLVVAVVCSVLGFVYTETGPIVLAVSLNLTVIVYLVEVMLNRFGRVRVEEDGMREISSTLAKIKNPYLKSVGQSLLQNCADSLGSLARPTKEYSGAAQYFRDIGEVVNRLGEGDRVTVACADLPESWNSGLLKRYAAANYAAVERGVDFVRIVVARQPTLLDVAREQARHGVRVMVLREEGLAALEARHRIPLGTGIGVINGHRIYFHSGKGPKWYGCMVECPMLAAIVTSVLSELEQHADLIEVEREPEETSQAAPSHEE